MILNWTSWTKSYIVEVIEGVPSFDKPRRGYDMWKDAIAG